MPLHPYIPSMAWLLAGGLSLCGYLPDTSEVNAVPPGAPRVFTMDGKALADLKKRMREEPSAYEQTSSLLKEEAGVYLHTEPYTITTKTSLPPSGDKHDYESQGPYWWPDPDSKDGLPYIRRDGERNPEITKLTDHRYMSEMIDAVKKLSLAYFLTDDERYGTKAAAFLRTWFITPETRMNPNLNYGQRIPGRTDGRGIGIIETRSLGDVTDAVGLLRGARSWSKTDQKGMQSWMRAYLDWLLNSENGKDEARQRNNHGTWYDVQVASLALFTGQTDVAKQALIRARDERLPKHIEPDGRQPFELARTRSWSYSVMNLQSFFTLAVLGEKVGVDLWHYSTSDGRSIIGALDYLVQFTDHQNPRPWAYKQITEWDPKQIIPLLYQTFCRFPDSSYRTRARQLEDGTGNLNTVYYPCVGGR